MHLLYRVYARSFVKNKIRPEFKTMCNLVNGEIRIPSLLYLYQFRVLVCTLATAATIARARDVDENFKPAHFAYTFIDEAACVHETAAMMAVAGRFFSHFQVTVKLLNSGNPQ